MIFLPLKIAQRLLLVEFLQNRADNTQQLILQRQSSPKAILKEISANDYLQLGLNCYTSSVIPAWGPCQAQTLGHIEDNLLNSLSKMKRSLAFCKWIELFQWLISDIVFVHHSVTFKLSYDTIYYFRTLNVTFSVELLGQISGQSHQTIPSFRNTGHISIAEKVWLFQTELKHI